MKQRFRQHMFLFLDLKSIWKPTLILWGVFLAIWAFISTFHLGFQHDIVGLSWGPTGAPVTFAQVIAVFAISFLLTLGWNLIRVRINKIKSFPVLDIVIFISLWAMAVLLWSREPIQPTHFSPPPMPPNNEIYPNSDALLFDKSSYHLLYGTGFSDQLIRRPVYVGMLAFFHGLVGGSYDKTVFLQILVLALMPSLIFLLTSKMSNRTAGLIAGGMLLLRETNSIALSREIVTSHAKLLMSDMITTLGVVIILYLAVHWLFKNKPNALEFAIVGACIGITALIRAQVVILTAPLLLFIFLSRKPFKQAIIHSVILLLGIVLVMIPWIWRNWNLTGAFVLDDRGEERLLARNYSLPPLSMPEPFPGETDEEFSVRIKSDILTFIRAHPAEVLHFVSNHFLRNLATGSVYVAPAYLDASPSEIVGFLPFWNDWNGDLTRNSSVALFLNLGIIAFGIGIGMSKNKWIGLLPLVVFLTYSFGNALVRSSGWRFNQPADWIVLVYYSMALAYLPAKVKLLFGENRAAPIPQKNPEPNTGIFQALILFILFLMGASVPIAERLIPAKSFDGFTESAIADLAQNENISDTEISNFLQQKDAVLVSGIALYPRFVRPNSRFHPLATSESYSYLHFHLMNEGDYQVVLPLQNVPTGIPHTATVSVIGCKEGNYISAFAVIVHEPSTHILLRAPEATFACPLPEPQQ